MDLKGSKTEQNLMTAFAGESQARNKYTYYASNNIKDEREFKKDGDKIWVCRNCGYVYTGKEALKVCPVCAHPQSFMEVKADNYE